MARDGAAARRHRGPRRRHPHGPAGLGGLRAPGRFTDPLVDCRNCNHRFRDDHLIEAFEAKHGRPRPGELKCPNCGSGPFTEPRIFNLMFKTFMGPVEDDVGRGLPAAGDRAGDLRQLPESSSRSPQEDPVRDRPDRQGVPQRDHAGQLHLPDPRVRADGDAVLRQAGHRRGVVRALATSACAGTTTWACARRTLRLRDARPRRAGPLRRGRVDIEYEFPFGWPELEGIPNRADFDLAQHQKFSGKNLAYFDQETDERYIPYVVEPVGRRRPLDPGLPGRRLPRGGGPTASGGTEKRTVLRFDPRLAPIKVAVLPAVAQRAAQPDGPRGRAPRCASAG